TVASSDMIEINFRPSVAWIDNQRLLYSWMVQINAADSGISLNEYDLTDGTSTDVDRQLIVSNFYRLDYSYFIGTTTSNQRVAFTLNNHAITVQAELGSADAIHYDSHSSVLLLEQQDGDILIVRSGADPLVVDVWGLLPENAYIVYLSPADSRG
ncbi:MAG TPA: hypothetical protein VHP83_14125, partial [Aggregatilineaceae bacterium]|nr:hypothetical protein [Aggregatilineaceae bacterium]